MPNFAVQRTARKAAPPLTLDVRLLHDLSSANLRMAIIE